MKVAEGHVHNSQGKSPALGDSRVVWHSITNILLLKKIHACTVCGPGLTCPCSGNLLLCYDTGFEQKPIIITLLILLIQTQSRFPWF